MRTWMNTRRRSAVALLMLALGACSADPAVKKQQFLESGNRYVGEGKLDYAIIEFRNAIEVDPSFGEAHARLADAYGQLARTERARTLPQFALSGGYHYLENRFLDDETVGVAGIGVQWALFDGGQTRKRAAALERTRKATQQQRAEAASLVELQVREYWLGVRAARERVRVTAEAAAQAEESLRIARERYGAGLGTHTQTLEAETLRVQALRNRDDARLDERLAELRLLRAAGKL